MTVAVVAQSATNPALIRRPRPGMTGRLPLLALERRHEEPTMVSSPTRRSSTSRRSRWRGSRRPRGPAVPVWRRSASRVDGDTLVTGGFDIDEDRPLPQPQANPRATIVIDDLAERRSVGIARGEGARHSHPRGGPRRDADQGDRARGRAGAGTSTSTPSKHLLGIEKRVVASDPRPRR